ncbi:hypothetical protein N9O59_02790 [Schleiferiaceae bacterium]|nr:hypothetical protein [Schleiferiaceae bacterium]MDB0054901.1 hypothetical protein [Schleiferiaceae bacterium]MDC1225392.1 hypothetical protein [Schleiferiaceae bacterium]
MQVNYSIIVATILAVGFVSCETAVPPHAFSGRYYGIDSIYTIDKLYQDTISDTVEIYLDVTDLFNGQFDIGNDKGYWVREGELFENKININVSPFSGKIRFFEDSIVLRAESDETNYLVKHTSTLTR